MIKLLKRLENNIVGDIIGALCLVIIFVALPFIFVALK